VGGGWGVGLGGYLSNHDKTGSRGLFSIKKHVFFTLHTTQTVMIFCVVLKMGGCDLTFSSWFLPFTCFPLK